MSQSENHFSRYILPDLPEARLARQWSAIEQRLQQRPLTRKNWAPWAVACTSLCVAGAALVWSKSTHPFAPADALYGVLVETSANSNESITLADGSRLMLEPATRLRLANPNAQNVRLELERGGMDVDVAHVARKSFVVAASGTEVSVVGTKFHMGLRNVEGKGRVTVSVAKGKVKLSPAGGGAAPLFLTAGESWYRNVEDVLPEPAEEPSADPSATPQRPAALPATARNVAPSVTASASSQDPHLPAGFAQLLRAGRHQEAFALLEDRGLTQIIGSATADELFELAEAARLSGHPRDAATALDVIRRWHRTDRRAGLAALELGRLRLDEFKDAVGAMDALDDAILLLTPGSLREDAEARRIEALDLVRWSARCASERDTFLQRHPGSPHAAVVETKCRTLGGQSTPPGSATGEPTSPRK